MGDQCERPQGEVGEARRQRRRPVTELAPFDNHIGESGPLELPPEMRRREVQEVAPPRPGLRGGEGTERLSPNQQQRYVAQAVQSSASTRAARHPVARRGVAGPGTDRAARGGAPSPRTGRSGRTPFETVARRSADPSGPCSLRAMTGSRGVDLEGRRRWRDQQTRREPIGRAARHPPRGRRAAPCRQARRMSRPRSRSGCGSGRNSRLVPGIRRRSRACRRRAPSRPDRRTAQNRLPLSR